MTVNSIPATRTLRRSLVVVAVVLGLSAPPAVALTDEEIFREFRFNLINPGARALGLGGAFLSVADDATAAQANPAGLAFLQRPEYFIELRAIDNSAQSFTTNDSPIPGIEAFVASGTDVDDVVTFSFLSVVTSYGRWTMGLSLQDVLNIDNRTVSLSAFTFPDTPGALLTAGSGTVDVNVRNFNVSVGGRITTRLSLGGTLTYSRLNARSEVINSFVDTNGFVAGMPVLEDTLNLRTSVDDADFDVVYSLGILYKSQGKWGVGAVYRRAPRFRVVERVEPLLSDPDGNPDDLFDVGDRFSTGEFTNAFNLPDTFGVGGHFLTAGERLTLSLDAERVRYSNLLDGFVPGVNLLTDENSTFTIDDATNVHLGVEYLFFNDTNSLPPMGLRGGVFTEADARIRAEFVSDDAFATEEVFVGGDTLNHATLGLGFSFQRFQLDVAADFSELDNEYLISFIYRGK